MVEGSDGSTKMSVNQAAKDAEAKLLDMISPKKPTTPSPPRAQPEPSQTQVPPAEDPKPVLESGEDPFAGLSGDPEGAKPVGDESLLKSLKEFHVDHTEDDKKKSMEVLQTLGFSPQQETKPRIDFSSMKTMSGRTLGEEEAKKELANVFG